MSSVRTMRLRVILNGTRINPHHKMGFTQNPFPQLGKAEYDSGERAINSLDGEPLKSTQDIRDRLKGKLSEEFIEACCAKFKKGERVTFYVEWKI